MLNSKKKSPRILPTDLTFTEISRGLDGPNGNGPLVELPLRIQNEILNFYEQNHGGLLHFQDHWKWRKLMVETDQTRYSGREICTTLSKQKNPQA